VNKKNYIWFNVTHSEIDGYPIWLSAPDQESANEFVKIMKRAKDIGVSTVRMSHQDPSTRKHLRDFNIILN
jgi:molybdenum cofactor biosynthesis enzyme MoaA